MRTPGLIHVYTGDGKGKTTAAIGLATRALGHGLRVCYCSFHKTPDRHGYTEMDSLRKLGATVYNFAQGHPGLNSQVSHREMASSVPEALSLMPSIIEKGNYQLLILDEILISVRDSFLHEECVLNFMDNKPEHMELVLTGRGATPAVMGKAHYVSEIQKIKHPYDQGIMSREGIEY